VETYKFLKTFKNFPKILKEVGLTQKWSNAKTLEISKRPSTSRVMKLPTISKIELIYLLLTKKENIKLK